MSQVYRITPLHKKSIVYHVEMYRENDDGSISKMSLLAKKFANKLKYSLGKSTLIMECLSDLVGVFMVMLKVPENVDQFPLGS